jgi:hypothetical protein
MREYADILIVCGQGTYRDGCFYSEFDDRAVCLDHALSARGIVERFAYTHVVASGGFTQKATPDLSEAESFVRVWEEFGAAPVPSDRLFLDEVALDSAENVALGILAARLGLGAGVRIRRIGVFTAWAPKGYRFGAAARALGIHQRFYFHGFGRAEAMNVHDPTPKPTLSEYGHLATDLSEALLLGQGFEDKRRRRYRGPVPYGERGARLTWEFPAVLAALNEAGRAPTAQASREALAAAYAEVLG